MKFFKAVGTIFVAMMAWILTFILIAAIDEAVGHWITDHEVTKAIYQSIIHGIATCVLLKMKANTVTAIAFNIVILVMLRVLSDGGMDQVMGAVMMLYIIPVYLSEKGGE